MISLSVGDSVLRFAAENHPDFWDGNSGKDVPNIKVTDISEFAKEVVMKLNEEREDGSTLVTDLLDKAIKQSVEDGCTGIDAE